MSVLLFYSVSIGLCIATIVIAVLAFCLYKTQLRLRLQDLERKTALQQAKYRRYATEQQIKQKLALTYKQNLQQNNQNALADFGTYKDCQNILNDLRQIYLRQIIHLQNQYPELAKSDITILLLIGSGFDNQDLAGIFNYSKRTIYKHRQNIAKATGISSLQLDEFARRLAGGDTGITPPPRQ